MTTISQYRFGLTRGLPRLLEAFAARGLPATFYIPGATALAYPRELSAVVAAGHEIGHHGHLHLKPHELSAAEQRVEIERGLEALDDVLDVRPIGYRAPFAELTPETFDLLHEHGFLYDSSSMGDDRPYFESHGGRRLLELPMHWSLDDHPYLMYTLDNGGQQRVPRDLFEIWRAEFDSAVEERRHVTFVVHPEVIGRASAMGAFGRFLDEIAAAADVWFATHGDVAAHLRAAVGS